MWSMQMTIFWIYSCSVSLTRKRFFFYICVELSSSFFIDSDVVAISRSVAFMVVERQRLVFRIEAIERLLVNSVFFLLSINSISCSDQFNFRATAGSRFRMPQIKAKPNLDTLKVSVSFMRVWEIERESDIFSQSIYLCILVDVVFLQTNAVYQSIKYGSGFGSDGTSPVARWSLVDMINNRQNGMGAQNGAFTQPQRCKINNNYIPNYKKSLFSVEKKIFCGTFSRDGNHFVTASQGKFRLHSFVGIWRVELISFSISFPHLPHTMTDSVIRIHDSSTPQYKRVNEIAAKNINWCILDVAFSPNGQYFAYSTWSSSSKYTSARHSTIFNRF